MISHKHKFIFIHIPKCAGTTIERTLYDYASDVSDIMPDCKWSIRTKNLRNEHLFNSIDKHNDYFTFTFCRNPYDRLVSAYTFFKLKEKYHTFNNFIKNSNVFKNCEKILKKDFCQTTGLIYHFLPGVYFIKHGVDFIGKVENLQEDFDIVCDKIGIPRKELSQVYKTKHKHYTEYYNDETRKIVAEIYAKDIEYFGYEFGQ